LQESRDRPRKRIPHDPWRVSLTEPNVVAAVAATLGGTMSFAILPLGVLVLAVAAIAVMAVGVVALRLVVKE